MSRNIAHKFYAVNGKICPKISGLALFRKDNTLYLRGIMADSIASYSIEVKDQNNVIIYSQTDTNATSFDREITSGVVLGDTYSVRTKSFCAFGDGYWTDWIIEKPTPHMIKLLTHGSGLEMDDNNKLSQFGDFKLSINNVVMQPNSTGFSYLMNRGNAGLYNRSISHRLGINYGDGTHEYWGTNYLYQSTPYIIEVVKDDVNGRLRYYENGVNNSSRNINLSSLTLGTSNTKLLNRFIVDIHAIEIDGESFEMTEGSGSTTTGNDGTMINILGVEGTDYQWELAI